MEKIRLKIRNLVGDNLSTIVDAFDYVSSAIFTLSEPNIDEDTLTCKKNGVSWSSANYSYDSDTGAITVSGSLTAGDALVFTYSAYTKYSDSELNAYIRNALVYLSMNNYKDFVEDNSGYIFPTPTVKEEYLISIISSILIKGSIKSYRTPEITITFAEDMSVDDKIKQAIYQSNKSFGTVGYVDLADESDSEPDTEDY